MNFIESHLGFALNHDRSIEALILIVVVVVITGLGMGYFHNHHARD
jgi:hypothetical protein